jgi:hypothetical protein
LGTKQASICLMLPLLYFSTRAYVQEIPSWYGEYGYYADYGKNAAGTTMSVVYTLRVDTADHASQAMLITEGYQTDDTINCKVTYNQNRASFFFKDFGNGMIKNKYDVEVYKRDQLLFTLEYAKHNQLITTWKALNPEDHKQKGFTRIEKKNIPPEFSNPDTEVSGISLRNSESARSVIDGNYILDEEDKVSYLSQDSKEKLTLSFYSGDVKYQFSEFDVSWATGHDKEKIIPVSSFKTNNGIYLGMTKEEIIRILGNHFILRRTKNNSYLYYEIVDLIHSDFLKKYNMPHYYAKYFLKQDRLVRFQFGFEYP